MKAGLGPASTESSWWTAVYWRALTSLTDLIALIAFVALVTRVAAGLRPVLPFACGALGVTFFVAILIHLLPLTCMSIMRPNPTRVR